jgi:hypothetical protein
MRELSLAQLPHPPENKTSRSKLPTINSEAGALFRIRIHSFLILLKTKPAVLTKLPIINSMARAMFWIRIHSFLILVRTKPAVLNFQQ